MEEKKKEVVQCPLNVDVDDANELSGITEHLLDYYIPLLECEGVARIVEHVKALATVQPQLVSSSDEISAILEDSFHESIIISSLPGTSSPFKKNNFFHQFSAFHLEGNVVYYKMPGFGELRSDGVFFVEGRSKLIAFITYKHVVHNRHFLSPLFCPEDEISLDHMNSQVCADVVEVKVYPISPSVVPKLLIDTTKSLPSRIISVFYALFPHLRRYLLDTYSLERLQLKFRGSSRSSNVDFLAATAVAVFGPAYSNKKTAHNQVFKRFKAAAASCGCIDPIDVKIIQEFFRLSAWNYGKLSPAVFDVIGRTVALDKDGNYNPFVEIQDLMTQDEMDRRWNKGDWRIALVTQAQLVYKLFRCSSLNFAINYFKNLKDICMSMGGAWLDEVNAFDEVYEQFRGRPYIGCVKEIPKNQQIATYPRLICLSVLYYEKYASTEKEDFAANYNIDGLKSHLPDSKALTQVEEVLSKSPHPMVDPLSIIAQLASPSAMESVISSKFPELRSQLYNYMAEKKRFSLWYRREEWKKAVENRDMPKLLAIYADPDNNIAIWYDESSCSLDKMIEDRNLQ